MGAVLIVLPWGGEGLWTQKARTTPGRKAMKVREKSYVSAPELSSAENLAPPVSIMSWSPAKTLLLALRLCCPKGVTHQTMNPPVVRASYCYFMCVLCFSTFQK